MIYSPNKRHGHSRSYSQAQVTTLRPLIHRDKLSAQQINKTKSKIQQLKKINCELQKQQHSELRSQVQESELDIIELQKEVTLSHEEYLLRRQQIQWLQGIRSRLQHYGEQSEQRLKIMVSQKEKLYLNFVAKQQQLLTAEVQITNSNKELERQRLTKDEVVAARVEVAEKWQQFRNLEKDCQQEKDALFQKTIVQRLERLRLQKQFDLVQRQLQKYGYLKQNSQMLQTYFEEMAKQAQNQALLATETQQDEKLQQQIGVPLIQVLQSVANQGQKVQKQRLSCQQKIKQLMTRINDEQEKKCKLQQRIAVARVNLRSFKEKNEHLKAKMNAIFKNDAQLIKNIASKKFYAHLRGESVQAVKKNSAEVVEKKQNQIDCDSKQQKAEGQIDARFPSNTNRAL